MNGKSKKDAKGGLQLHMERDDEKTGRRAAAASTSAIDPTQSKYNVAFIKSENAMKRIKDKFDIINEKRKEEGLKKARSNKNIFLSSTIQLGNDTLEALGWDKEKKCEDQTDKAIKNVTTVYKQLVHSANKQPDRYGVILEAHLHFDETTPHVDMIQDCLDVNDLESGSREFLNHYGIDKNGKKENYKKRLIEAQDHLADYVTLKPALIEKIGLVRGESEKDKIDFAKQTRNALTLLENTSDSVKKQQEAFAEEKRKLQEERDRLDHEKREIAKERKELQEFNQLINKERSDVMNKHFDAIDYVGKATDIGWQSKKKLNTVLSAPIDVMAKQRREQPVQKIHEQAVDDLELG